MQVKDRYSRQILLKEIQGEGQEKISNSSVAVIGCGALGNAIANNLARAGIGYLRVVDRDIVELNNIQRQCLFDEEDVGFSKAEIIAEKLRKINSEIIIDHIVDDVTHNNIEKIIKNMDVILDGTDNMLIRFLINDACVKHNIPWIYGGAIKNYGITMNIIPNRTPCFRCLISTLPKTGSLPTCDTVGVLNSIPVIIASIQSTETLKIILGENANKGLLTYDVWTHDFNNIKIKKRDNCECCGKHDFEFLNSKERETMISLCGKGAIQITPAIEAVISFDELGNKLQKIGEVSYHKLVLRFKIPNYEINIFKNGRAIIIGTNNKKIAKSLYSKYIGF